MSERMTDGITKNGDELSVSDTKHHTRGLRMSETERQFRAAGWSPTESLTYKWTHPDYASVFLPPETRDDLMDMWLTGLVAGKEAGDE